MLSVDGGVITSIIWLASTFTLSACIALLVTPLVIRGAAALKLFDTPDGNRHVHEIAVPRLGGVAFYLAAAGISVAMMILGAKLKLQIVPTSSPDLRFLSGALGGSALLFVVGLLDDVRGLSAATKGVAQFLAAALAITMGARMHAVALGYGVGVSAGMLEIPLLLLWIIGVTNAFNFIDGLNGLAGGIAVVAAAAIAVVAAVLGNVLVLIPAIALGGGMLGFLRFNYPKGKIFLGDAGSMSAGFLLAVLSLRASVNRADAALVIVPVLALFVPLTDMLLAIVRRWLRHVPLTGADARHIHHRLLALGLSHDRAALILWTLAASMASFGLVIALTAPFVAASIAIFGLVGVTILLIYGTNILSYHELTVAGEVLMSAPRRARRVISDQIMATDLTNLLRVAKSIDEVGAILSDAAEDFGFLAMELAGEGIRARDVGHDRIIARNWAWKLDYPIRLGVDDTSVPVYVLSIWCTLEVHTRPYGAERVARILGPALRKWFEHKASSNPEASVKEGLKGLSLMGSAKRPRLTGSR
jgi:UDP-GlcNAc:undecaprenyl-phosphate GlcNAc-1-phosphate transferase